MRHFIIDRTAEKFEQMDTAMKASALVVYVIVWVVLYNLF